MKIKILITLFLMPCLLALCPMAQTYAGSFPGVSGGIVYQDKDSRGALQVHTAWLDGSHDRQLTSGTNDGISPSYSADGTKITFVSHRSGTGEIYAMNTDGSGQVQLTSLGASNTNWPSYSPDNSKIAFQSNVGGTFHIYTMNADGTNLAQLGATICVRPAWSPNGASILCYSGASIYSLSVATGAATTLVTGTAVINYVASGSWSPDGTKITFGSNRDNGGAAGAYDVYTMNADGTNQTRLTFDGSSNTNGIWAWSPDGSRIYFGSNKDGDAKGELYSIKPDGSDQQLVLKSAATDYNAVVIQPLTIPLALGTDTAHVVAGSATSVDVLANDSSVYGSFDPSTVQVVTAPTHGTATANADGTVTYAAGKQGGSADTFTYQACLALNTHYCGTATVNITISPAVAVPGVPDTGFAAPHSNIPALFAITFLVPAGLVVLARKIASD